MGTAIGNAAENGTGNGVFRMQQQQQQRQAAQMHATGTADEEEGEEEEQRTENKSFDASWAQAQLTTLHVPRDTTYTNNL